MQIDLQTIAIKPLRHTFDNIARRIGADKPATRYQEGTLDMQQEANYHYRPTWDPDHLIYDRARTVIKMADWYSFKDPRQFYYGAYTMARAKQQDTAEANFDFVERRGLAHLRQLVLQVHLAVELARAVEEVGELVVAGL